MILTSSADIIGIIGAAATVMTVFVAPIYKWIRSQHKKYEEEQKKQQARDQRLAELYEKILNLEIQLQKNNERDEKMQQKLDNFFEDNEDFVIQNLKYMINDAYLSYSTVQEIPDEKLINACECCEIYVNKKHLNHEIHPRCEVLWAERERRALIVKKTGGE